MIGRFWHILSNYEFLLPLLRIPLDTRPWQKWDLMDKDYRRWVLTSCRNLNFFLPPIMRLWALENKCFIVFLVSGSQWSCLETWSTMQKQLRNIVSRPKTKLTKWIFHYWSQDFDRFRQRRHPHRYRPHRHRNRRYFNCPIRIQFVGLFMSSSHSMMKVLRFQTSLDTSTNDSKIEASGPLKEKSMVRYTLKVFSASITNKVILRRVLELFW